MIIDKLYFMGKKERTFAQILSLFILLTLICTLIASFVYAKYNKSTVWMIRVIVLLLCTLSIGDIINLVRGNLSVGYRIVRYLKYKRRKAVPLIVTPTCNSLQQTVCEGVSGSEDGLRSLVHIYGFPDRGKTTTAFFILQGIFLNSYKSVTQVKKMMFIDCSVNKDDVLALFDSGFDRLHQFQNSIVVLDNVEQMGIRFIELNRELFLSNKNLFILIEDSDNGKTQVELDIFKRAKQYDFSTNFFEKNPNHAIWHHISSLSSKDKSIFFAIYFSIYTQKYVLIDLVANISMFRKRQIVRFLKEFRAIGPFAIFPFNKEYIYCNDYSVIEEIPFRYMNDAMYSDILRRCVNGNYFNQEGRWLCLVQNNINDISEFSSEERLRIFNDAISGVHFKVLYKAIDQAVNFEQKKRVLFGYEYGVLSYYMGLHKQSYNLYRSYLDTLDHNTKMKALVRIIEATHGSCSDVVMSQLQSYIKQLRNQQDYEFYADYWQVHIEIEKGNFDITKLNTICNKFREMKPTNDYLYTETVKRCYTDLLRCHYALNIQIPMNLEKDFSFFLQNTNKAIYDYYFNLMKAYKIQYLLIPHIELEDRDTKLIQYVIEANAFYEMASSSDYLDQKFRRTLLVKQAELRMILADADAEKAIHIVEYFLMQSQANDVDVHEAYSETLLAKIKIVDIRNLRNWNGLIIPPYVHNDIQTHLENARKIYVKYNNSYGIFRINFILFLYKLYVGTEYKKELQSMVKYMKKYNKFKREQKIWSDILKHYENKKLTKMYLLWCIRSYPIIMQ